MADVTTKLKYTADLTGINAAVAGMSQLQRQTDALGAKLRTGIMVMGALGIAAAGAAAVIGVKFNASLEQARIGFTVMLGSAEKADEKIKEMAAFAKTTPFQFPDVLEGARRLNAMGFSAENLLPIMKVVGDAVAAIGGPDQQYKLMLVVKALGDIRAAGQIMSRDMLQLTSANINAWKFLAEGMNLSIAQVKKLSEEGKISAATGLPLILKGMEAAYGGMMQAQSRSLMGLISNITDASQMMLAGLFRPLFERAKEGAAAIESMLATEEFERWANETSRAMARAFDWLTGKAVPTAIGALVTLRDWWTNMGEGGQKALMGIAAWMVIGGPIIGGLKGVFAAIRAVTVAFGVLKVIAFGEIYAIMGLIAGVVEILRTGWQATLDVIGRKFQDVGQAMVATNIPAIKDMGVVINNLGAEIWRAGVAAKEWPHIWDLPGRSLDALTDKFDDLVGAAGDAFGGMEQTGQQAMAEIKRAMESMVKAGEELKIAGAGEIVEDFGAVGDATEEATKKIKKAAISVQEMAEAFAQVHPSVQVVNLRLTGLSDQLAGVNAGLEANARAQRVVQAAIQDTQARISALNDRLSQARDRLRELTQIRLPGQVAMEERAFQLEAAQRRLRLAELTGQPVQFTDAMRQALAGLMGPAGEVSAEAIQKALDVLRLQIEDLTTEPMRRLREAAEGVQKEMTFEAALRGIISTKAEVGSLEGALRSANDTLRSQQAELRGLEEAASAMRETAAALQKQIAVTEQTLQLMTKALQAAAIWMLEDRKKMADLGEEAQAQAEVVDEKTQEMLALFDAFARGEAEATIGKIWAVVAEWQKARDAINQIAGTIAGLPAAPAVPEWAPPMEGQHGGVFTRPTVLRIAEAGPEAVLPVGATVGGGVTVNISAQAFMGSRAEAREFARAVAEILNEEQRLRAQKGTV